jgi:glycosyltransferase involved in cell wall biosynthesis
VKILCVIDHFGSGGAQRQLVTLAVGLKARGHDVRVFIYHPGHDFFRSSVAEAGIPVYEVQKGNGFSLRVLRELIRTLRAERFDGIISFLDSPNVYSVLASLAAPGTRVIVSERASRHLDRSRGGALARRLLLRLADVVVANSRTHAAWLEEHPWLRGRTATVYNGYPLDAPPAPPPVPSRPLRLLVVGRVGPEKNGLRLVEGLAIFHARHGHLPEVSWAGNADGRPAGVAYRRELDRLLELNPVVKASWSWLGERSDVPELLEAHHALVHPSLHEGLPNVVCEALIAGRPVLASNVCDHPLLVEDGRRGFLFDPEVPSSIADAIESLHALRDGEWQLLAGEARRYAEQSLSLDRMVGSYEALLLASEAGTGESPENQRPLRGPSASAARVRANREH